MSADPRIHFIVLVQAHSSAAPPDLALQRVRCQVLKFLARVSFFPPNPVDSKYQTLSITLKNSQVVIIQIYH